MEGKISRTIGEYTYVSAKKPINVIFSVVVPARGSMYWSESYTGDLDFLVIFPFCFTCFKILVAP